MLLLWSALAFAAPERTQVFASDDAAVRWIRQTRSVMRTTLPVVGDVGALRGALRDLDVRVRVVPPSEDPDEVAFDLRAELGSPCAIGLAPLDEGWVGWTQGSCTMRYLGLWRNGVGNTVLDDRGRGVTVPQFASASGDEAVFRTYRRLDRARGRGVWFTILGSGLMFAGQIGRIAAINDSADETPWWVATGVGAGITGLGLGQIVFVLADERSHPHNLGAHYTPDEIRERVKRHNAGLRILSAGPGGIMGTF
jgi:hypothetical protein